MSRPRHVHIIPIILTLAVPALTHSTPAFDFGISAAYTEVAGSEVNFDAFLRNAGDEAFTFTPARGFSAGLARGPEDDWEVIDSWTWANLRSQFAGLTLAPGEIFGFSMASFSVPQLPVGATSNSTLSFQFEQGDLFAGTTAVGTNLPGFSDQRNFAVSVGEFASRSPTEFFSLCVVNRSTRTVLSGPEGCEFPDDPVDVPEPATMTLFLIGIAGVLSMAGRRTNG